MKRALLAGALAALSLTPAAEADTPEQATVWVGLGDSLDGFLIDEETGNLWMTGPCLKRLPQAEKRGESWVSISREMASVGRLRTLVDQTFHIDTTAAAPSIGIDNPSRGGLQALPDVERVSCTGVACAGLMSTPVCAS
ncbi:MAG: hypothetical protein AAF216_01705 [Pseudomonadota bacterium]